MTATDRAVYDRETARGYCPNDNGGISSHG